MTEYILYGGKGGVGKTTCAAATGYKLANEGRKTLVVSTDPAHSLSDSFETEVTSEPGEVIENLWATEVDPEEAMNEYRDTVETVPESFSQGLNALGIDSEEIGENVAGLFDDALGAPGSDEAAAMFKFMEYMDSDSWEYVVFDTAPTGHTLRLLEFPEIMDSALGKMVRLRSQVQGVVDSFKGILGGDEEEETTYGKLEKLKNRIERVRGKLVDPNQTDFRVVTIPENMAITETQRLIDRLSRYEIPAHTVVINKVMEDINQDCDFCQDRWAVQEKNLEEANEKFCDLNVVTIPLMRDEVQGLGALEAVGDRIETTDPKT